MTDQDNQAGFPPTRGGTDGGSPGREEANIGAGGFLHAPIGSDATDDGRPLPSRTRTFDVVCAVCGLVERTVPLGSVFATRLQHEMTAHPEVYRARQELDRLDRELWPRSG